MAGRKSKWRKCKGCGKNFIPNSPTHVYCIPTCRPKKICEFCGKSFVPTSNSKGRFCSQNCFKQAPKKADKECIVCGKVFKAYRKTSKYCSRKCQGRNRKNIKIKTKSISKKALDAKWSRRVKQEAGYKCEICGNSDCRLNSHHIIGRRHMATRWYIPNGICLCVTHHLFGNDSAHQNSVWFLKEVIKLRGQKWLDIIYEKSRQTFQWQKHLDEINFNLDNFNINKFKKLIQNQEKNK